MFSANPRPDKPVGCIRRLLDGVVNVCRSFCLQTTIHGFNHIAAPKRHWVERLLWACVTATAAWGVVDVSLGQWQRYRDHPTVVTLEKDFRSWTYAMVGVTACYQNRTDPKKAEKAIKQRWNVTKHDPKYKYYFKFADFVANSDIYQLDGYSEFVDDSDLNVDLYRLAVDVMPTPRIKLTQEQLKLRSLPEWVPVMTEMGACHTINSVVASEIAIVKPNPNATKKLPITCKYNSQGCSFVQDSYEPMKGHSAGKLESYARSIEMVRNLSYVELPQQMENRDKSLVIRYYFHSAYDIPDMTGKPYATHASMTVHTDLNTVETRAGPGIRALPPRRRNCLYTDEPTDPDRQVYSTTICQQGCKSRLLLKMCGCKPFHYFYTEGPLCTLAGMQCVASVASRLPTLGNAQCPCMQLCVDSVFYDSNTVSTHWTLSPLNVRLRGSASFKVLPPHLRYTRTIVFHFQDLVVSFGGAAGLFLGASFISFVEIGYFLIERILGVGEKKKDPEPSIKTPPAAYEHRIQELTSMLERQNYNKRYYLFE